jgi:ABC-type nitrate/sulfonate/bicarbonate transport system permease component
MATVADHADSLRVKPVQPTASSTAAHVVAQVSNARSSLFALAIGIMIWEIVGRMWQISFLPPFSNVLGAAAGLITSGQILGNLAASLLGLFVGYALAVVCGVGLGVLMGRYRKVEHLFDVYINAFLAAPKIALIPVLFALFGVSRTVQVAVVFLSAFFIIVINTMSAIRSVDASYIEMARSFGAREHQLFWQVLIPGAVPLTMAGLRLGMGRAVKGMINGEMFIAVFGLGGLLRTYGSRFDAEKVFAILLVVIAVALVCSALVETVEQRLTRWMEPNS